MSKIRNIILIAILLMVAITACSKSPETARKELGQMNIDYTKDNFAEYVKRGDKVVVDLFLTAGMSPNQRNSVEDPILIIAAGEGHEEIVKLLIAKGADVNGKDKQGFTALMLAAVGGNAEIVKALLNKGADVDAVVTDGNLRGRVVMNFALESKERNIEVVKALVNKGVLNDKNLSYGLYIAKEVGYTEAVDILKKAGAKDIYK